jgi:hypothetical protein
LSLTARVPPWQGTAQALVQAIRRAFWKPDANPCETEHMALLHPTLSQHARP